MKTYTCSRCGKFFFDKTKYIKHLDRTYKCKYKKDINRDEEKLCNCVLCDMKINDSYKNHLENSCVKSKKKNIKYGYKSNKFANNLFKNASSNTADLYLLSTKDDNKSKFNFLKNMYTLITKVEDMTMYDLKYYLPIKNIDLFLEKIKILEKNIVIGSVLDIQCDDLLNLFKDIINEVNDNIYILNKPIIKIYYEYICPKCQNIKFNNIDDLYKHLEIFHFKTDLDKNIIEEKVINLLDKTNKLCNLCGKTFSSISNKNKHTKICENKSDIKENVDYLIQENNKLHNEVKLIKTLLSKEKQKKTNIINNTTNIMQNNIQININDYGKEDISHIPMEFVKDLISKMNAYSIVKYIEAVHFKNPMNTNIVIPNDLNVILMKNGNSWAMNDKDYVLNGMIVKNFDRINDIYEKISQNLPNGIKEIYTQYAETFDTDIPNERERVKVKTEEMIINKQNNIIINQLE